MRGGVKGGAERGQRVTGRRTRKKEKERETRGREREKETSVQTDGQTDSLPLREHQGHQKQQEQEEKQAYVPPAVPAGVWMTDLPRSSARTEPEAANFYQIGTLEYFWMRWGQVGVLGPWSSALWLQRLHESSEGRGTEARHRQREGRGWEDLRLSTSQVPT